MYKHIKIYRHVFTLSLSICLFALSSPLLQGDGFFPIIASFDCVHFYAEVTFYKHYCQIQDSYLQPANHLSWLHRARSVPTFTQPLWKYIHFVICLYTSSTFPFVTAVCPNDRAPLNSLSNKINKQIHCSNPGNHFQFHCLYLLVNISTRL